jgi:hypothetical protein
MEKTRKCEGCGANLKGDYRNEQRQHFCAKKACQKLRRTLRQRLRRQSQRTEPTGSKRPLPKPNNRRRPQEASLISEAEITAENPVIIGLISMITGSTNLEEIQATYRQLWLRGVQILEGRKPPTMHNSDVINFLQAMEQNTSRGD